MKRALLLLYVVLLLVCMTPFAAFSESATYCVTMDDQEWGSIDHEHCRLENKQQLVDEVSDYIQAIVSLTGKDNWQNGYAGHKAEVEIVFTGEGSHVEGGYYSYAKMIPRIYINRGMAEYNFWPLAHELTHLICQKYSSLSLREGLASYIQDTIGKNCSVFNYGVDVHALAQLYLTDDYADVIDAMGSIDLKKSAALAGSEKRAVFYRCSYSFSKYLIEKYGIQNFMELYECPNLLKECKFILGKDLKTLKADWKLFLHDYPHKATQAEIDRQMSEIMSLHGSSGN